MNPAGSKITHEQGAPPLPGAVRAFESALSTAASEISGTAIGPYKLLQKLGEGGFGVVWMAEQHEPIRRRVALKIIKVGMDTEEVIARFEVERQALALMDHPNIARVFDAGATATGRPYFVMELVRGIAITRYCDENRVPADARLRLFISVCQAVQHAHQKGVIHRDLKPSNILVTLHDGVPVPKIIDFGIAKATDKPLTEKTLFTQFHTFIGTPAYTSPEQMEMSGLDVDTRSDIYSLGVLLYELLAGRTPFDSDALVKSGLEAMRRTIREIDPPRPSTRLGTLPENDRTSIAHQRGTDAGKLSLLLRGDLDWIAMRCLEKDRTRRYETANAIARDVQRHLAHEPVAARPPSQVYRIQKFVRRHRVGVAATVAIAVLLLGGLVASSMLLVREHTARTRAVAAEQSESKLRHEAETAREMEAKRASRTALTLAEQYLNEGKTSDGLAYLVHVARNNPLNPTLAPRLVSVLTSRNFLLPEAAPVRLPSPAQFIRHFDNGRTIAVLCEDGTLTAVDAATGETRLGRLPSPPTTYPYCGQTGRLFSFLSRDGAVRVIDFGTMQVTQEFRFPKKGVAGIGHDSSVSTFLVRLEDDSLQLCDAATGRSQPIAAGIGFRFTRSRNGRWLATASTSAREIQIRDLTSGVVRSTLALSDGKWAGFVFSPDGQRLATTQSVPNSKHLSLQLWSVPDGLPLSSVMPVADSESGLAYTPIFSDDGRFLISWGRTSIEVRNGSNGLPLASPVAYRPAGQVFSWRFTHNGQRMLTWWNTNFTVWDLATGRRIGETPSQEGVIRDLVIAEDDRTAMTVSTDGYARVWDLDTQQLVATPALQQRTAPVSSLSPDSRSLALGTDSGEFYRFKIGRGAARPLDLPFSSGLRAAPFMDGAPTRVLSLRRDGPLAIEISSGRQAPGGFAYPARLAAMQPHAAMPSPDLKTVVARTAGGKTQSWKIGPGGVSQIATWQDVPTDAEHAFTPSGDRAALYWGRNIRVWDIATGAPAGPTVRLSSSLNSNTINFSPDGRRLAAGGFNGETKVWEIATGREAVQLPRLGESPTRAVQFSPDGTRIVVANFAGETRLFDAMTGRPVSPIMVHSDRVNASFSPDGRYLETHAWRTLRLWDGHSGSPLGEIVESDFIREPSWDSTSTRLALTATGKIQTARIWDVRTLQPLTEPMVHTGDRIQSAIFSPDNRFIRTVTVDGIWHFWSIPPLSAAETITPAWLLDLATACAGKALDVDGKPVSRPEAMAKFDEIRRTVAALPNDSPLAEWGRWFLADRATRSIAPGFTITPAEAEKFTASLAGPVEARTVATEDEPP